jgi:hypothetical protein
MDKYQFKLIKGDFSPQNAKSILMDVINSKISFHNLNMFSKFVKNSEVCESSKQRVSELSNISADIIKLIKDSEEKGMTLRISGDITIEFIKE